MYRRIAWLLVGVAVTMAFALAGYRWWLGQQDRTVDLVLDGRSYRALAREQATPYVELLAQLKQRGATAVAVAEQDLAALQEAGLVTAKTGARWREDAAKGPVRPSIEGLLLQGKIHDGYTYVETALPAVTERLKGRLIGDVLRSVAEGVWEISLPQDVVGQLTFGFDESDFAAVKAAGLRPVPRPANFPGVTPEAVARVFTELDKLAPEARSVIFQGREMLGYPTALGAVADAVRQRGWVVGLIEQPSGKGYIVQQGQELVAELVGYRVTRVTVRPEAVAERGARMVYLKGVPADKVEQAARQLSADFRLGLPGGLTYVHTGRAVTAVLSLALAGALMLLSAGGWPVGAITVMAALIGPYVAPSAALSAQAAALGLIPALALLSGPGGSHDDPDTGLAVSWRVARYAGPGVSWVVAFGFAALAAAMVALAMRGSPPDLLGMTPAPPTALTVSLSVLAFLAIFRDRLHWDAQVTGAQMAAGALVLTGLGAALMFPVAAPALIGAAALAGSQPAPLRQASLALAQIGAVALAMAPATGALVSLAGVGMGLALYAYHTSRGSASREGGRGRETA